MQVALGLRPADPRLQILPVELVLRESVAAPSPLREA
jgi:hypothetical protein